MNTQREVIYGQRKQVLEGQDLHEYYQKMISQVMREAMLDFCADTPNSAEWDTVAMQARISDIFGELPALKQLAAARTGLDAEKLTADLTEDALQRYEKRQDEIGSVELMREAERFILLRTVDSKWMDHIDTMDDLRDSIGMRGYAQHDPVVEYRKEGFTLFEAMTQAIQEDSVRLMMRARFTQENVQTRQSVAHNLSEGHGSSGEPAPAAQPHVSPGGANRGQSRQGVLDAKTAPAAAAAPSAPVHRDSAKVGRNDPCPCGSGKKYKNCHGRQDSGL